MGVLCQPRVGAGLSGIPCLLGVRVILPPPRRHPQMLGTPFSALSAVGDLGAPLDSVRVPEVIGMQLENVGRRRQAQR